MVTLSKCDQKPECMPSGSLWKLHVLYMKMTYYFFSFLFFFFFHFLSSSQKIEFLLASVVSSGRALIGILNRSRGTGVQRTAPVHMCTQPELKSTPQSTPPSFQTKSVCVCVEVDQSKSFSFIMFRRLMKAPEITPSSSSLPSTSLTRPLQADEEN